ncbi:MAG: hypothetical protein QW165_01820 [Candidatus Woesearchaeota archaeon]
MFKSNESLDALCSFFRNSKCDLRLIALGIAGNETERLRRFSLHYITASLNKARIELHMYDSPVLPHTTKTYAFIPSKSFGVEVKNRENGKTYTTLDAIALLGRERLPTVIEARIGGRNGQLSDYFKRLKRKMDAMSQFAPYGFGWLLALPKDYAKHPSPLTYEFEKINGKVVLLPFSSMAVKVAVEYYRVA